MCVEACMIVKLLGMQTTLYIQTKRTAVVHRLYGRGDIVWEGGKLTVDARLS
jgi:hypothetical protein